MIKQKKGAEAIVVWILLIGFTLAATATVFIVEKNKSQEIAKSTVNFAESRMECNEIAINNVACLDLSGCNIPVKNTGRLSIYGMIFRDDDGNVAEYGLHTGEQEDISVFPMKPGEQDSPVNPPFYVRSRSPEIGTNSNISIIPIISISDEIYACKEKMIIATNKCSC